MGEIFTAPVKIFLMLRKMFKTFFIPEIGRIKLLDFKKYIFFNVFRTIPLTTILFKKYFLNLCSFLLLDFF